MERGLAIDEMLTNNKRHGTCDSPAKIKEGITVLSKIFSWVTLNKTKVGQFLTMKKPANIQACQCHKQIRDYFFCRSPTQVKQGIVL